MTPLTIEAEVDILSQDTLIDLTEGVQVEVETMITLFADGEQVVMKFRGRGADEIRLGAEIAIGMLLITDPEGA